MKPATVWGYYWDKEIQEKCRKGKNCCEQQCRFLVEGVEQNVICVVFFVLLNVERDFQRKDV